MPPLVRFGMKTPMGKGFLKHYDFEEAYFFDKATGSAKRWRCR